MSKLCVGTEQVFIYFFARVGTTLPSYGVGFRAAVSLSPQMYFTLMSL